MDILVVSGFLGAGKTTFITELAKKVELNIAVFENEYGNIGIDGDLLRKDLPEHEGRDSVWELTEGCICCSLKGDFRESVLTIANAMNPDLLIIEPSGVAMLSSVLENLRTISYDRIQILEPLTLVDALHWREQKEKFEPLFTNQIAATNHIVITKGEDLAAEELGVLIDCIKEINQQAAVINLAESKLTKILVDTFISTKLGQDSVKSSYEEIPMMSLAFKNFSFRDINQFYSYMSALASGRFGDICRVKGFCRISHTWGHFDIVGQTYTLRAIEPQEVAKAVIIGRNLDEAGLSSIFSISATPF